MAIRPIKISFISRKPKVWAKGPNKCGKYVSVGIKIEGKFSEYINGIGDVLNEKWEVGTEINLDIKKKVMDDGRIFYNFKNPTAKDLLADLIERVEYLENIIKAGKIGDVFNKANGAGKDDNEPENLPL